MVKNKIKKNIKRLNKTTLSQSFYLGGFPELDLTHTFEQLIMKIRSICTSDTGAFHLTQPLLINSMWAPIIWGTCWMSYELFARVHHQSYHVCKHGKEITYLPSKHKHTVAAVYLNNLSACPNDGLHPYMKKDIIYLILLYCYKENDFMSLSVACQLY